MSKYSWGVCRKGIEMDDKYYHLSHLCSNGVMCLPENARQENFQRNLSYKYPRFVNRLYALFNGYFWIPCPLCGTYFGGHEWFDEIENLETGYGSREGVCRFCPDKAKRINTLCDK